MKFSKLHIPLLIIVVLFFYNCSIKKEFKIDSALLKSAVINTLNTLDSAEHSFYIQIYDTANFASYWFASSKPFLDKIDILNKSILESGSKHGLSSSFFAADSLHNLIAKIDTININYNQLAQLELLLSKSYYDYCAAINYGVVSPEKLYPDQYFIDVEKPDSDFITKCFSKTSSAAELKHFLNESEPKDKIYKVLQKESEYLYQFKDSVFKQIPEISGENIIKSGEKNRILPLIARRLMLSKELPYSADIDTLNVLTPQMLGAINKFRKHYSIETFQNLDNNTIKSLNRNPKDMYWKLAANMERVRWKYSKPISKKHIWVNCATQRLKMMRGDSIENSLIVGVGRSGKHQTPLLIGDMYQIVLNPTWTVPKSIVVKEISMKSDPNAYISRNHMKVFKKGVEVNPDSIKWTKINDKYQPYVIVQDSGATNSLGRVKFNFNNPFSIYLHDTNAKYIFNYNQRDVSHGCVRVQSPLLLAFFCMKDINKGNAKAVKERLLFEDRMRYSIGHKPRFIENAKKIKQMGASAKVRYVSLNPRVTVVIDYRTCYADKNNKLFFANDIYKMDDALIAAIKKPD